MAEGYAGPEVTLHNCFLDPAGVEDPETLEFWCDLLAVQQAVHQSMSIVGPWMEARAKGMLRTWLGASWSVSGPCQIFDQSRPGIRTRSWDAVVHRSVDLRRLPPAASPESGIPLVPLEAVAVVIDTKTYFSDVSKYAKQSVFNLMNDSTQSQLEFLGPAIPKVVLAAASDRGAEALRLAGSTLGLSVFSLAVYRAGPVDHGAERMLHWKLERLASGTCPLQAFKDLVLSVTDPSANLSSHFRR